MRWLAVGVFAVSVAIIGYGIFNTVQKNLLVGPSASAGAEGRQHPHAKNISRLTGSPEDVYEKVLTAVYLDQRPADAPDFRSMQDWLHFVAPESPSSRTRHAVVLPVAGEDALVWALPGLYWAAYSGVPAVFAGPDGLDGSALNGLPPDLPLIVLAPESLIPDSVIDAASAERRVVRVAGRNPQDHAVRIAEADYEDIGFGWGRTHHERDGYFHFVLAAPQDAVAGLAALPLARTNSATFLMTDENGGLSPEVDRYLWAQRTDWAVTPSAGPFRHLWMVGNRISYAATGRADLSLEKAPYATMGPAGLGGMEALAIALISFGIGGAVIVYVHAARLLPEVMLPMRLAWTGTALFLPVIGVALYFFSYLRPTVVDQGHTVFVRPPSAQAAAATAMGFGFGAPLMVAFGWLFGFFGFPLIFPSFLADGWVSWLGAGMFLMMAGMYLGAIVVAAPMVQGPMREMMMGRSMPWTTIGVTTLSMSAVALGMMTTSWIMLMEDIPMMPHEDEILFFGAFWYASVIGFLIAWPLNWPMVRAQLKSGAA